MPALQDLLKQWGYGGTQTAAERQAESSQANVNAQTQANRPNINTQGGYQTWGVGPDGRPTLTTGLAPGLQGAWDDMSKTLGQSFSTPFMFGNDARDQAINAAYGQATSRLDPMWDQREQALQTRLANQGLDMNSEAGRNAMRDFGLQRNDAYSSAMNGAIAQGTEAGAALFGQNMAAKMAPLQAMQGLFSFGNQTPGFNAAGAADATQYLPAQIANQNFQLGQENNNNNWLGGVIGGGAALAGAALPFFLGIGGGGKSAPGGGGIAAPGAPGQVGGSTRGSMTVDPWRNTGPTNHGGSGMWP